MEAELVQHARGGSVRAQEKLVLLLTPRLLPLALRLANDSGDAEDLLNEALYRGVLKLAHLRDPEAVVAWFQRILVHLWRDRLRSRRPRERSLEEVREEPQCDDLCGAELEAAELAERVNGAIASLPPMQRAVLALHLDESLSVAQIAPVLGASREQVKANLWHARRRLRVLLAADLDGEH